MALLQQTGIRFKHLISHRRTGSLEDYNDNFSIDRLDKKATTADISGNVSKRTSWRLQNPNLEMEPMRRASSSATTRSRPSPPVIYTAHSSASSLCSCECAASPAPNSLSPPASQPMEPRGEILYLPPATPEASTGDAKAWRLIFPEDSARPRVAISRPALKDNKGRTNVRSSTFDLLEALTIDPVDHDRTPTQSIRTMDNLDVENVSENVEQLIQETDEALKAVGNALAEAKAATHVWHDDQSPGPVVRRVSVSRGAVKRETPASATFLKSPITRTKSVGKGKRKSFYNSRPSLLRRVRNVSLPPVSTPARWTLTDVTSNMVDIFHGKIFRTEVDEMLTPDRLHRLKEEERIENERRLSLESAQSIETDDSSPTEQFHLEGLSSRVAAAQIKLCKTTSISSPDVSPPKISTSPSKGRIRRKEVGTGRSRAIVSVSEGTDKGMEFRELNFPSPPTPPKIPTRLNVRGTPFPLPTIPEVLPLKMQPGKSMKQWERETRQESLESIQHPPDFILLPSTRWTLTSPLFKQGAIRVEQKEKEISPDDDLDWTAFQMAISGTMDEIGVDERDDIAWAADEADVDDILRWWAGYRFPHHGLMIREPTPTRAQKREAEIITLETQTEKSRANSGTDKIVVELPMKASAVKWVEKSCEESMPPSPKSTLPSPTSSAGDGVIPMRFNLGHDLGDFLDWEAHYVRKYFGGN